MPLAAPPLSLPLITPCQGHHLSSIWVALCLPEEMVRDAAGCISAITTADAGSRHGLKDRCQVAHPTPTFFLIYLAVSTDLSLSPSK